MKIFNTAAAVAALIVLGGCADARTTSTAAPTGQPRLDLSVLERLGHGDCDVYATPAGLAAQVPIVLSGTVSGLAPGPTYVEPEVGNTQARRNLMVFKIDVDRVVKGREVLGANPKQVFLAMGRGMNTIDSKGAVLGHDGNPSVDEVRKAIPVGTRVIAFTGPHSWATVGEAHHEQQDAGRPKGSKLLGGFFNCDGAVNFDPGSGPLAGWGDLTFSELSTAVDMLR